MRIDEPGLVVRLWPSIKGSAPSNGKTRPSSGPANTTECFAMENLRVWS